MAQNTKPVMVVGDPTVDWLIVRRGDMDAATFWGQLGKSNVSSIPGGSALLTQLLERMFPGKVEGVDIPQRLLAEPMNEKIVNTLTIWQGFNEKNGDRAMRISEWLDNGEGVFQHEKKTGVPQVLMIEDANLGFRDNAKSWPAAIAKNKNPQGLKHIIIKTALFHENENKVLQRIIENGQGKKTTVLISINDLRKCPVQIGTALSWERTFKQVANAVMSNNAPFAKDGRLLFQRVIVSLGPAGAVIVGPKEASLVFDKTAQEGDWQKKFKGSMMGYNTCMAAALAGAARDKKPDWNHACLRGLLASRKLHRHGYQVENQKLRFPLDGIARELKTDASGQDEFGIFTISTQEINHDWSILSCKLTREVGRPDQVYPLAARIVKQGVASALPDVPVETVGKWSSADSHEIRGVRSVRNLLAEYLKGKKKRPLSVAVFGPPGAGKSFAIKQVARSFGKDTFQEITFNLSQFQDPQELIGAFHQVRDINLSGMMPLVFWDEFDSSIGDQQLGWLRYFLSPMQDDEFLENGIIHPLGPGVYVFAGGTAHRYEEFCADMQSEFVRQCKKPDFISRLKGFVNILGPDPNPNSVEDKWFMIRRAFILNVLLHVNAGLTCDGPACNIDEGVLNAFLNVSRYKHGTRSLESIIEMSALQGQRSYELSALPPEGQLELHVDADEFMQLTRLSGYKTLKVGVVGHRFLAEEEKLRAGIRKAIGMVEKKYPRSFLAVFSPLAEGADRLVASELSKYQQEKGEGEKIIAVLPFPPDEYEKDFESDDAYKTANLKQEFRWFLDRATETIVMPPSANREEAYQKTGNFIADNCDVLFAIWDGKEAQGVGGTAEFVNRAKERGIPVLVIRAGNRKPGTQEATVHKDQGKVFKYNI